MTAHRLTRPAPAKINLALHVVGPRPDGFHDLDTLVAFADFADQVTVAASPGIRLNQAGPFGNRIPRNEANLVHRAATTLQGAAGVEQGALIGLEKNLPPGAGFGGGSSDAAATLHLLNAYWELNWSLDRLAEIGQSLGADIPMCLQSRSLRAQGIGNTIHPGPHLPDMNWVLAWPGREISTAEIFAAIPSIQLSGLPPIPTRFRNLLDLTAWLSGTRNDLEEAAGRRAPEIPEAIRLLTACSGCRFARMSGSGSGCFGLFGSSESATAAARSIRQEQPHWWVQPR